MAKELFVFSFVVLANSFHFVCFVFLLANVILLQLKPFIYDFPSAAHTAYAQCFERSFNNLARFRINCQLLHLSPSLQKKIEENEKTLSD